MAVTEAQARARIRAFRLLERLFQFASTRLSVTQRDFRTAKIMCDQLGMAAAIKDIHVACLECNHRKRAIRKLGISRRVS